MALDALGLVNIFENNVLFQLSKLSKLILVFGNFKSKKPF
jgi:hypothetical protein